MRRYLYNDTAQSFGAGDQMQPQATKSGAMRTSGADSKVLDVTFTLDTSAYASADLVADTQAVSTTAFDQKGGCMILDSITMLDEDDQKVALYAVFLEDSTSMGTENAAPSISDANARKILGVVPIASGDWLDIGGSGIASVRNIGLPLKAASGSQALYVALVNAAGTPTYTANGLRAKFGFRQA
jgi:hypothetical protein